MAANVFDPGDRAHLFDRLDPSPGALCDVLHGVLIHDYFGAVCYPQVPPGFATASRETVPVAARLAEIDRRGTGMQARPPERRVVGTCRDFALMFCAMARHHGMVARVRCGFADYLDPPHLEDHWICEYRMAEGSGWKRADPQIDAAHAAHLNIGFDPVAIPVGAFLTGCEAWQAMRRREMAAEDFGHGSARGAWFLRVNLVRDLLCLQGRLVSDWDRWREIASGEALEQALSDDQCDRLAEDGSRASEATLDHGDHLTGIPAPPFGGAAT